MARIAATRTHFVDITSPAQQADNASRTREGLCALRDYAVEERNGRTRARTIGWVSGGGRSWTGFAIGAAASTLRYPTRDLAVAALRRREDFRQVQSAAYATQLVLAT